MNEKKEIAGVHQSTFESIRKVNQSGQDFWSARDLSKVLGYSEFRHFIPVINKAKEACENSVQKIGNHFEDILEMVPIGSGARREIQDVRLSRLITPFFKTMAIKDFMEVWRLKISMSVKGLRKGNRF